jgi:ATP-binding cassette subfamily B protein/subfamily B ATP-binding cassette protein MsbA
MALTVVLDVLRPWPAKILVDHVLGQESLPEEWKQALDYFPGLDGIRGLLVVICLGTVMIFLARTVLTMISVAASVTFGQRMVYDLGAKLFLHLQRQSLLFHSRRPLGDMIGRVTGDTYCVQTLVTSALVPLLQSLLTLIVMFVVMWRLEPTMTLLAFGVTPVLLLLIWVFGKQMKQRSRLRRDLEARMIAVVEQTLSAMPVVQAFTREEGEYDRFRRCADETVDAYRRSTLADMWFKLLIGLTLATATAGLMWLGATRALEGRVTVGTILVFLAYLACLYDPLAAIVFTAPTLQSAAASAERVLEILDLPPDIVDAPEARAVALEGQVVFDDVTFGYDGREVLKGVSLEARPGEVIAIVGPTGAGKTTVVNLLLRFYDPWSGSICVDGHDLRCLQVRSLREQVAIVLQDPFIFPLSVADNLAYGKPGAGRTEIVAAAVAANADEFIRRLPQGYDTLIGEKGATLSGGEKQRLAIARALLKDAPILVLDEPTSALDARTEHLLLQAIERLMAGRTTFIIAHRLSTIRKADKILVLDQGEIVEAGRHEDLLAQDGLYASLYWQQMNKARVGG